MYLLVLFWFASAAYQASLLKPCLLVWRGLVEQNYLGRNFFLKDTPPLNFFILRRREKAVVSNKVFMSNNKGGRKLKFHCLQETERYFCQERYVTAFFQTYLKCYVEGFI